MGKIFLTLLVVVAVLFGGAYLIAMYGTDIAAWAMVFKLAGVAIWLRKTSITLRNLPPFNDMEQVKALSLPKEEAPKEPFNLWEWLRNDSKPFFSDAREVVSNGDMWMTVIILFVVAIVILAIVNIFRGKFSLTTFKSPLQGSFKDAQTSLNTLGFISFFVLAGLVVSEGAFGRGWDYVGSAFTQFWWIGVVGVIIWAFTKSIGSDIGKYIALVLGAVVLIVFLISLQNDVSVGDLQIKVPLASVSAFASDLYNGWMPETKTYFWFLIMGIGSYLLAPMLKKSAAPSGGKK